MLSTACRAGFTGRDGQMTGGAGGSRTPDLRLAKAALYQLSYGPIRKTRPSPGPAIGDALLGG